MRADGALPKIRKHIHEFNLSNVVSALQAWVASLRISLRLPLPPVIPHLHSMRIHASFEFVMQQATVMREMGCDVGRGGLYGAYFHQFLPHFQQPCDGEVPQVISLLPAGGAFHHHKVNSPSSQKPPGLIAVPARVAGVQEGFPLFGYEVVVAFAVIHMRRQNGCEPPILHRNRHIRLENQRRQRGIAVFPVRHKPVDHRLGSHDREGRGGFPGNERRFAVEDVGGKEMIIVVMRDQQISYLSQVNPVREDVVIGVGRKVYFDGFVDHHGGAGANILSSQLPRLLARIACAVKTRPALRSRSA